MNIQQFKPSKRGAFLTLLRRRKEAASEIGFKTLSLPVINCEGEARISGLPFGK